jgi:CRP-like cAMP-binding protein
LRDDEDMRLLRPRIETLRATTMFAGLDGDILTDVAWSAEEIEVVPGQIVVRQAEPGDALFAVMEGEIRFEKNGAPLGTATAGHAFGELSIIDGSPRGATAIATRPGRLLRVRRTAVHSAMARHPDVWLGLARSLAAWIRKA